MYGWRGRRERCIDKESESGRGQRQDLDIER